MIDSAALQKILHDPNSNEAERAMARRQLGISEPCSEPTKAEQRAVELCGPLGLDLLPFVGVHELLEVTWRDLVRFTDSREWPGGWQNHDIERLWLGWIVWGNGGINFVKGFRGHIWDDIKKEFATDEERRAEFERLDREYPLFHLAACDSPREYRELLKEGPRGRKDPRK